MKKILPIFASAMLLAFCAESALANIIDSTYGAGAGSFELGSFSVTDPVTDPYYMAIAPGGTVITGWTVGGPGDGVDWVYSFYKPDTGTYAVDLTHLTASSIATVIPTVAGDVYKLTFGAASVLGHTNTGVVSAGSLVNQAFTAAFSNNYSTQSYTPFSFFFTATGATTTIQFIGDIGTTHYGPIIDSVCIDSTAAAVPEPATMLLFGTGIAGLAALGRRKRS